MNDLINAIDQVIEENDLPHKWSKGIAAEIKELKHKKEFNNRIDCLLYTSTGPRD